MVNKFGGFSMVNTKVEHIVQVARNVGVEGFNNAESSEVVELLDSHTE